MKNNASLDVLALESGVPVSVLRTFSAISDPKNKDIFSAQAACKAFADAKSRHNLLTMTPENEPSHNNRTYAIALDFDPDALHNNYQNSGDNNAYEDLKKALESHGFSKQQGGIYFGEANKVDAVACVLAVMDVAEKYAWFYPSLKEVRMLRIEDNNNLMPAVIKAATNQAPKAS